MILIARPDGTLQIPHSSGNSPSVMNEPTPGSRHAVRKGPVITRSSPLHEDVPENRNPGRTRRGSVGHRIGPDRCAPTTATQPGPGWSALKSYTGTIVQVDPTARRVSARDAGGQTSIFEAPAALESSELASFRPGDMVTVTFYEGVQVRPKPAGGAPVATSVDPATGLRTATVTIKAIDPVARTVTFTGPRGRYTRTVPEGVDASMLRALTIGERADLTYFEYVQSMTRTKVVVAATAAPPAAPMPPNPTACAIA